MKYLLSVSLLLFLLGCSESNDIPAEQSALKDFLENKGYQVISYEGQSETYKLTKEKITELPYILIMKKTRLRLKQRRVHYFSGIWFFGLLTTADTGYALI
ncbi:hypothetical protein J31TS6_00200 [Brevibacillus reuszeri]|uniref:hypothetical protein n=1 Tax=Brevibacillus reuszeri TaxID=54915 RepID=UPI001B2B32FB|nr:hypothetical protein [Brevibacillus reuszeri]GIO03992.1 hypothetical protein J31TS6_00200 [Brevibacillus reuszeri]